MEQETDFFYKNSAAYLNNLIISALEKKKYSFEKNEIMKKFGEFSPYKKQSLSLIIDISKNCLVIYTFENLIENMKIEESYHPNDRYDSYNVWGLHKNSKEIFQISKHIDNYTFKKLEQICGKELKKETLYNNLKTIDQKTKLVLNKLIKYSINKLLK